MDRFDNEFVSNLNKAMEQYKNLIESFNSISEKISKLGGRRALPVDGIASFGSLLQTLERDINHQIEIHCPEMPSSYRNELTALAEDPYRTTPSGFVDIEAIKISFHARIRVLNNMLEWYSAKRGKKKRPKTRRGLVPFPIDESKIDELSITFVELDPEILLLEYGHRKEEKTPTQAGFSYLKNPKITIDAWDILRKIAQARGHIKDITKAEISALNVNLKALLVIGKRPIQYDYDAGEYRTLFECAFKSPSDHRR